MSIILKQEIGVVARQLITLPVHAKILSFQKQRNKLVIWYMAEQNEVLERRIFQVIGTGNEFYTKMENLQYIGTVQDDNFVWHLFEEH
jgi:hypothetical protein